MKVLAVSCITNIAAGMSSAQIDHSEVMAVGERAGKQLAQLIVRLIPKIVSL
jgi:purine-nucleoside phosphorylase